MFCEPCKIEHLVSFKVVIPARYASSRLPGKVLLKIKSKPVIQYVYENACVSRAEQVVVATDDQRIMDCVQSFNAEVCLTSSRHKSGTDRIAEVAQTYLWEDDTVIVNVQGDEPMMPADNINQVARSLIAHPDVSVSTLCTPILSIEEYNNSNVVKVIRDESNMAVTFSRKTASAYHQNYKDHGTYRHLGIYAYRVKFLKVFTQLPQSELEKQESLEQLRALENNESIFVDMCDSYEGVGVDTQEDYEALLKIM